MKSKLFLLAVAAVSVMTLSSAKANDASSDVRLVNQNFYGVILYGNANVYVLQGDVNSVKVVGSNSNVKEISTTIVNGNLVINSGQLRNTDIYITMPEINLLQVNGSGMLRAISTVNSDMLQIRVTGTGTIYADVRTLSLAMTVNGSGKIYIGGVTGESFTKIKGNGQVINMDLETVSLRQASASSPSFDGMLNHKPVNLNN